MSYAADARERGSRASEDLNCSSLAGGGRPYPSALRIADSRWWVWTGGLLGGFYVRDRLSLRRSRSRDLIALVVAGQPVASLLVDQFGLVGFAERHISPGRIAGMPLVPGGVTVARVF
jgi:bacterial/archaeal transporter family-2 protein